VHHPDGDFLRGETASAAHRFDESGDLRRCGNVDVFDLPGEEAALRHSARNSGDSLKDYGRGPRPNGYGTKIAFRRSQTPNAPRHRNVFPQSSHTPHPSSWNVTRVDRHTPHVPDAGT